MLLTTLFGLSNSLICNAAWAGVSVTISMRATLSTEPGWLRSKSTRAPNSCVTGLAAMTLLVAWNANE